MALRNAIQKIPVPQCLLSGKIRLCFQNNCNYSAGDMPFMQNPCSSGAVKALFQREPTLTVCRMLQMIQDNSTEYDFSRKVQSDCREWSLCVMTTVENDEMMLSTKFKMIDPHFPILLIPWYLIENSKLSIMVNVTSTTNAVQGINGYMEAGYASHEYLMQSADDTCVYRVACARRYLQEEMDFCQKAALGTLRCDFDISKLGLDLSMLTRKEQDYRHDLISVYRHRKSQELLMT